MIFVVVVVAVVKLNSLSEKRVVLGWGEGGREGIA